MVLADGVEESSLAVDDGVGVAAVRRSLAPFFALPNGTSGAASAGCAMLNRMLGEPTRRKAGTSSTSEPQPVMK